MVAVGNQRQPKYSHVTLNFDSNATWQDIRECFERRRKENELLAEQQEIRFALNAISNALFVCNKYTCISCSKAIMKFLTHKLDIVRGYAANAFEKVSRVIALALLEEEDPTRRNELMMAIFNLLTDIKNLLKGNSFDKSNLSNIQEGIRTLEGATVGKCPDGTSSKEDEGSAISRIATLLSTSDKQTAISSINQLIKYVTHPSPLVRKFACDVIIVLLEKAIDLLVSEENPVVKENIIANLDAIAKKISNLLSKNLIPQDVTNKVKSIVTTIQDAIFEEKNKQKSKDTKGDLFLSFEDNELLANLNQIKKKLIGNISCDQFVSALSNPFNDLIGNKQQFNHSLI